jgi:hypothetical protein
MGSAPARDSPKEPNVTIASRITNHALLLAALIATIALMLVAIAASGSASKPGSHSKIELAGGKSVSGKPSRRA